MTELTCTSPIDGSVAVSRQTISAEDAMTAVEAARKAQKTWRETSLHDRTKIVRDAIGVLEEYNDDIVIELSQQMGRPVRYGGEIGGVKERAFYMADIAERALAPIVAEQSDVFTRYIAFEPVGVVFVIAPWNYPFLTAINAIAPALLAGNAVVLKHATQTILAGDRLAQAFAEAGLPEGIFQNLYLTHDATAELLTARAFDFVNFTGSVAAGRTLETAAAGTFVGMGLELGGKDPGYVRADANLDAAVETLIDGAMFNSGQCCCGIERIYVDASLFDAFVEKAKAIVDGYVLGNPLDPATTLGPMSSKNLADDVRSQIADAIAAGATGLIDPASFPADDGTSAYLAPQILIDVDHSMAVMREENFGPVVGIMPVSGDDEAISLMNDSPYGLSASLWTQDADAAATIGNKLETGTVYMNRCDYLDPALCWTGCKDTGRGASLSELGFRSVTRPKSFHLKTKT